MEDQPRAITDPDAGYELCYACEGERACWLCHGDQVLANGERCGECTGRGWCIVCGGAGQLRAGSRATYSRAGASDEAVPSPPTGKRVAKIVGYFRELGDDDAPPLADVRGKRAIANQAQVVAYLKAGRVLVMSPGLVKDPFDRSILAGTRSTRTDGVYAWPDALAFYVERYQVELPAEFEEHMAKREWTMPAEIDIVGLVPG